MSSAWLICVPLYFPVIVALLSDIAGEEAYRVPLWIATAVSFISTVFLYEYISSTMVTQGISVDERRRLFLVRVMIGVASLGQFAMPYATLPQSAVRVIVGSLTLIYGSLQFWRSSKGVKEIVQFAVSLCTSTSLIPTDKAGSIAALQCLTYSTLLQLQTFEGEGSAAPTPLPRARRPRQWNYKTEFVVTMMTIFLCIAIGLYTDISEAAGEQVDNGPLIVWLTTTASGLITISVANDAYSRVETRRISRKDQLCLFLNGCLLVISFIAHGTVYLKLPPFCLRIIAVLLIFAQSCIEYSTTARGLGFKHVVAFAAHQATAMSYLPTTRAGAQSSLLCLAYSALSELYSFEHSSVPVPPPRRN